MPGQAQAAPDVRVTLLGRFAVSVGGVPVAEAGWKRRHAAAVVKVLALAPGRRLHREQVIDLIWPDDTIAAAIPKLHKAAHYARRAIGVPDAVVLRGDQVLLCPGVTVTVDAVEFGELARRALDGTSLGTGPGAGPAPALGPALRPAPPWPAGRWRSTPASCCPATGTRSGPSPAATSSGVSTWSCCGWTAAGRRWPSSTRPTSRPTSP